VLEEVEVVGVGVAGGEVAPGERGAEDRHGLGGLGGAEGFSGLDASRRSGLVGAGSGWLYRLGLVTPVGSLVFWPYNQLQQNRNTVVPKPGRTTMILRPMVLSSLQVRLYRAESNSQFSPEDKHDFF
jgi:hypothetical protein